MRHLWLYLFFALFLGCASVNQSGSALLQSFFTDYQFTRDGFWIHAPQKRFIYSRKKNRHILKMKDDRLNEVVLIDQGCDGKVDEIRLNRESRYFRGDDKSEPLFQEADRVFQKMYWMLGVEDYKRRWKLMTPADIAGHNGLTQF